MNRYDPSLELPVLDAVAESREVRRIQQEAAEALDAPAAASDAARLSSEPVPPSGLWVYLCETRGEEAIDAASRLGWCLRQCEELAAGIPPIVFWDVSWDGASERPQNASMMERLRTAPPIALIVDEAGQIARDEVSRRAVLAQIADAGTTVVDSRGVNLAAPPKGMRHDRA